MTSYSSYELILDGDDEITLSNDSGLDFDDFSEALKSRGIEIEEAEIYTSE